MSDDHDPCVREIGRITDEAGCEVIVGVDYDAVTLLARHPAGGAAGLGPSQTEELAQLIVSAAWQAAWQTGASLAAIRVEQARADGAP